MRIAPLFGENAAHSLVYDVYVEKLVKDGEREMGWNL